MRKKNDAEIARFIPTFLPLSPLSISFASCASRSTRRRAAS